MHKLDINKKNKLDISKLDLLLTIEMGFFSDLKKMKIGFNPRPFSKSRHLDDKKSAPSNEKFVDLHLETVKKIDEIIEQHKKESGNNRFESKKQESISLQEIEEVRESKFISPEISPSGQSFLQPENVKRELDQREEFFEIESPVNFSIDVNKEQEKDIQNWMIGDQDKKTRGSFWNFVKMKTSKKENKTDRKVSKKVNQDTKINNVTKTKLELEKSKQEIEKKKNALETAIKKEKQKELELQKEIEEKKKQEKLKKLESKKKRKEQKIREKEAKKTEKQRKRELELQKKLKIKAEKELQQKRKEEEKQKQENLKKLEEQKKLKQIEALKAEKELQQKRKEGEKQKQEKLKKLEIQKKLKEKEAKKAEKEKHKKKKIIEEETIEPESQEPADLGTHIEEEKETIQEPVSWDEDVEKLLPIIDNLFANLPDNIVDEFTQSEDFKLYEKVMLKYTNK